MQYPSSIRIVRVPCTGRVAIEHILTAIARGAWTVFVAGCKKGECAYEDGNLKCERRVQAAKRLLEELGYEPERVDMFFMSSAEADKFVEAAKEMHERAEELGPP